MQQQLSSHRQAYFFKLNRCTICSTPSHQLTLHNLTKKYYSPQAQSYHYRTINSLLFDPKNDLSIVNTEVKKLASDREQLKRYYNFRQTVSTIKTVVSNRVEVDFYGWVDFSDRLFRITVNYYKRQRELVKNRQKMQDYFRTKLKQHPFSSDQLDRYFSKRISKELDRQRTIKLSSDTNSTTINIDKPTSQLDSIQHLINKFGDLSIIKPKNKDQTKNKAEKLLKNSKTYYPLDSKSIKETKTRSEKKKQREILDQQETYGLETLQNGTSPVLHLTKKVVPMPRYQINIKSIDLSTSRSPIPKTPIALKQSLSTTTTRRRPAQNQGKQKFSGKSSCGSPCAYLSPNATVGVSSGRKSKKSNSRRKK